MTDEKLDEARRLNRESLEKFRAAHEEAKHKLEETEDSAERVKIIGDAIRTEREAVEESVHSNELLQEVIDESRAPTARRESGEEPEGDAIDEAMR